MNRAKITLLVDFALIIQFALFACTCLIIYINPDAVYSFLWSVNHTAGTLIILFLTARILLNRRQILFTARKFYRRVKKVKEGEVIEANYVPLD